MYALCPVAQITLQAEVERIRAQVQSGLELERGRALLAAQLRQQMPSARQCGSCGFGPIEHMACWDLQAHQGQQVGNARIDNRCPRCSWFNRDIRAWPAWDGTLPEETADARLRTAAEEAAVQRQQVQEAVARQQREEQEAAWRQRQLEVEARRQREAATRRQREEQEAVTRRQQEAAALRAQIRQWELELEEEEAGEDALEDSLEDRSAEMCGTRLLESSAVGGRRIAPETNDLQIGLEERFGVQGSVLFKLALAWLAVEAVFGFLVLDLALVGLFFVNLFPSKRKEGSNLGSPDPFEALKPLLALVFATVHGVLCLWVLITILQWCLHPPPQLLHLLRRWLALSNVPLWTSYAITTVAGLFIGVRGLMCLLHSV